MLNLNRLITTLAHFDGNSAFFCAVFSFFIMVTILLLLKKLGFYKWMDKGS